MKTKGACLVSTGSFHCTGRKEGARQATGHSPALFTMAGELKSKYSSRGQIVKRSQRYTLSRYVEEWDDSQCSEATASEISKSLGKQEWNSVDYRMCLYAGDGRGHACIH